MKKELLLISILFFVSFPLTTFAQTQWFSDWSTSTGSGTSAIRDGGKWTSEACMNPLLSVISSIGLNFPTTNVLRVDIDGQNCRKVVLDKGWTAPVVGEYLYMRYYTRNAIPAGVPTGSPHHTESHIGDIGWAWTQYTTESTPNGDVFSLGFYSQSKDVYYALSQNKSLPINTTYRIEMRLKRTSTSIAKANIRVYSASGSLLYDENDFLEWGYGNSWAQDNPDIIINNVDEDLRSVNVGQNGPAPSTATRGNYVYFGAYAARVSSSGTDWIGSYPNSVESGDSPVSLSDPTPEQTINPISIESTGDSIPPSGTTSPQIINPPFIESGDSSLSHSNVTFVTPVPVICAPGDLFSPKTGQACTTYSVSQITVSPRALGYAFGSATVRKGTRGTACMAWQSFFNAKAGASLVTDGICGPLTIAVARSWQASAGLVVDGLLGPASRAKANMQ